MATPGTSAPKPSRRSRKVPVERGQADAIIDRIYSDDHGQQEAQLQRIDRSSGRRISRRFFLVLVIPLILVGASVAGFFTFNRAHRFSEQGVGVSIDVPATAASGAATTIVVTINNDGPIGIRSVELGLTAPEGWTFQDAQPAPADQNGMLWRFGAIGARSKSAVRITGTIVGEVGSVATFNVSVTYRPTNFNYDFTARASNSLTIGASTVRLELAGPTQVAPGNPTSYRLTYTNTAPETLSNLQLTVTYPDGFTRTKLDPSPREQDNRWIIDELAGGAQGTLTIDGTFSGEVGGSRELRVVADLVEGTTRERQVETSIVILLAAAPLKLSVTVNDSAPPVVAQPGARLAYVVTYRNDGDVEVRLTSISVAFSGGAFEAKRFSDDFGLKLVDDVATWTPQQVPGLANLKPGSEGTIRFSLTVPDVPSKTAGSDGPTIVAQVAAQLSATAGETAPPPMKLDPTVVSISSNPSLGVEGRYYGDDGELLGSGPIPPTVGQATTYRISWFLGNTTNELSGVAVTAVVPPTVFWTGRNVTTTAGDVAFDPATRAVTWTLNRLPANVGRDTPTLLASFEVSVTPRTDDVGTIMTLLEPSKLTATDRFTHATLTVQRERTTTDLPTDPRVAGRGVVVGSST